MSRITEPVLAIAVVLAIYILAAFMFGERAAEALPDDRPGQLNE